jgi:diaminohydroxyphosphoribosylaminopyrimidine deaminase / 5-amino-6-(5-phosphoribosylamino)uracil reductase
VLGRRLEGLQASRLALTARARALWVVCGERSDAGKLEAAGARIFRVPEIGGGLWLPSAMEALVAEGITRLLVEGGPATWRGFSEAGLVDEAVLFHARARGGAALSKAHAIDVLQRYVATTSLQLFDHRTVGSDDMMVFRRHWLSLRSPVAHTKAI